MYGGAQAFCQSREVDRRLVPFAVVDALDIIEDVAAIQNGEGSPKVNASIFCDALAVMLVCFGCFFWRFFILVNIQNGA